TRDEFETFYNQIPERVLIILDEAYFEFCKDRDQFPDSMTYRYDNVITLRTFSKAYGLAGLRIGYGFAHDELIRNLLKVKVPFEPSYLAQVAGFTALDDFDFLEKTISVTREGKEYFQKELKKLKIKTNPSATNFITTIWGSDEQATSVNKRMLKKGVILRHLTAFGWPDCIRISIGLPAENRKCIEILKTVL
ncbi:MAG: aminotransferase class I/II-fold pyridoxal phosphate-dependent enzyme, partial [Candidatus Neomarinimicrobiota bacterium]